MSTTPGPDATMGHSYRAFVSYSRSDINIVRRLVGVLRGEGVAPMWDDDLLPGSGFSDQIQSFIANSHVLVPVLTPASAERPWLHQEIGFAIALGKPVLPIALGGGIPQGIIGGIQAVELRDDLADAATKLRGELFYALMAPLREHPVTYQCTEDNLRRAKLLAHYAQTVLDIRHYGRVRQMASLTTFALPDRGGTDPAWRRCFQGTPADLSLFDALRDERAALLAHAQKAGCRLIIDPVERLESVYRKHGTNSVFARVAGLLSFLRSPAVCDVVVAVNDEETRKTSLTLVGDWFSSEAVSSGEERILRESVFTRCASLVQRQVDDFDHRMDDLLALRGWSTQDSREMAIAYLEAYLAAKADPGTPAQFRREQSPAKS